MEKLSKMGWLGVILLFSLSMSYAQGIGYLLEEDAQAALWWAEGAYKIKKEDPVPSRKSAWVELACARNEYEPFLLVLRPKRRMDQIRLKMTPLVNPLGDEIPPELVSILHVDYVEVVVPTDEQGARGLWPDPLPPYEGPFSACAGENHPFWITVFVPAEADPGEYRGTLTLSCGEWQKEVQLRLKVWDFVLPTETHLRSSFGISTNDIRLYHNLETQAELEFVTDLYYQNLRHHRVSPRSPFDLYPIKIKIKGVFWKGGEFVTDIVHGGRLALKLSDTVSFANTEATYEEPIAITPGKPYKLSWFARAPSGDHPYTVLIQCYNAEGELLPRWNILRVDQAGSEWKQEILKISGFFPEVRSITLHFFPAFRDEKGTTQGTIYLDDVFFGPEPGDLNLLKASDFEIDESGLAVDVDFSDFDRAAHRYLDDFGFNAFDLRLEGFPRGSFYHQEEGILGGFRQGTPEYERLLSQYLRLVENHLAEHGWLGKEYIYWFDEPNPEHYPFVRQGMELIRRAAPRLTRFITEHQPGPDIMDVSEISCTIFHRVNPEVVASLIPQGREFWSYLCTGPKAPWVTLFIDHPDINLRIWTWMSFQFGLKGILVWRATYWNSPTVFPPERVQNPWEDPMAYTHGYGTAYGKVLYWGNGDGRFLYPPNKNPNLDKTKYLKGPVNSIRWEILREGIEDYEYLWLLEAAVKNAPPQKNELAERGKKLLRIPETIFKSGQEYTKDARVLLNHRRKVGEILEEFYGQSSEKEKDEKPL
ncbi:MAG: glycoside hydrolase domain-containing protein [Candidatus Aminicenantales bacterium]